MENAFVKKDIQATIALINSVWMIAMEEENVRMEIVNVQLTSMDSLVN